MNWTEADRQIFEYVSPEGEPLYADPLAVRRALLQASGGQIDAWWKEVTVPEKYPDGSPNQNYSPLAVITHEAKIVSAVRQAFGLADFDPKTGKGAIDKYALVLANSYLEWMGQKKTDTATTPISSTPSAGIQDQKS